MVGETIGLNVYVQQKIVGYYRLVCEAQYHECEENKSESMDWSWFYGSCCINQLKGIKSWMSH